LNLRENKGREENAKKAAAEQQEEQKEEEEESRPARGDSPLSASRTERRAFY